MGSDLIKFGIKHPPSYVGASASRVTRSTSIEPEGEGGDDVPPHAHWPVEFHAPPPFSTRVFWLGVGSVCNSGGAVIWLTTATASAATSTPTTSFLATHRPRRRLVRIAFVMGESDRMAKNHPLHRLQYPSEIITCPKF